MDPFQTAAEEPRRLSDFLRTRQDEILADWEAAVRKMRAARNLDRPLLLDHMPQFIEDLAAYVDDLRAGLDARPPEENPRIHALERLEVGYDLTEVVAEYAALRSCITELAVDEGSPAVRSVELPRLHHAIDQAIAASVSRYTEAREKTLRGLDRISSAALLHPEAETLLPAALDAFLATTASVDSVALLLREEGALRVKAAVGFPEGLGEIAPADSFAARVCTARIPLLVRDASTDAALVRDPLRAPNTHALYGVPLAIGDQMLGAAIMGSRTSYEFSQEDQFLFRTLVHRVAGLIAQARLSAEIRRRAAELEAIIDAIPEGVYVGNERQIRLANAAGLATIGYESIDELNRDLPRLQEVLHVRPHDGRPMESCHAELARAEKDGRAVREVVLTNRKTGQDVVVRSSLAPVRNGSGLPSAVRVTTDLTDRLREEEELRAALDFRDRIFAVLGHDLRNPLTVILTTAALLDRGAALDETQRRALRRLTDNAQRIERMVHDLIDYTRVGQGRGLPVVPREADLVTLCQQVIDGFQAVAPDRPIRFTASGDPRGRWDPDRATQVISNLLSNAVRYSPAGSTVTVTLRGDPSAVVLEIHNGGAPIDPALLPRLFDAFQRGRPDESGRSAGLGLGLWIAQQIVVAHGGSIEARSSEQDGTTFVVRWPRG